MTRRVSEQESSLGRLATRARRASIRLRLDAVLARLFLLLPLPLLYSVAALTWLKVARPGPDAEGKLLLGALVPLFVVVVGTLHAAMTRRSSELGSLALDRHHGLSDRITSALAFRSLPKAERTSLMEAAIEDAVAMARDLAPRRAAPLHVPRELPMVLGLVGALVLIALFEVRSVREIPPEHSFDAMVMSPDDIDLMKDLMKELEEKSKDPDVLAGVRRFNQLIEDIAAHRLDRREVFKRMEELDRDLLKGAEAEKDALDDGLKALAKELEKSDLTKPVADPLKEKRLADAEKAMRELAEKLRRKQKPDKAQLDKMRAAMRQASAASANRSASIDQRRKELEEQKKKLLDKKKDKGELDQKDKDLLHKKERELERLNREKDKAERSKRQLSRLDRELQKAAEDLMKEMGQSADALDAGAEDLNRMAKEEMTQAEKEELRRRLQELRELLRQQGKGGAQQLQRLMRFGQRARGQKGQGGQGGGMPGKGGKGLKGDLMIGKGLGGKSIEMSGGSGQGDMPGSGQGDQPGGGNQPGGQGAGEGGKEWGTGHDPNLAGKETDARGRTHDVSAAGIDTGQGSASSQVIWGAAERGFVGRGYQKVYTDYKTVAEQVMNKDDIPPGYRFYVQRYFQLIRPRE